MCNRVLHNRLPYRPKVPGFDTELHRSSPLAWLILIFAGLLEVGWAIGLKYTEGFTRLWPSIATIAAMIASMYLLALAAKTLPIGTAYAVWTGIGAAGAAILGIVILKEPASAARIFFLVLLLASIVGLKLTATSSPSSPRPRGEDPASAGGEGRALASTHPLMTPAKPWKHFPPGELVNVLLPETRRAIQRFRDHVAPDRPAYFVYHITHWRGPQYLTAVGDTEANAAANIATYNKRASRSPQILRCELLHSNEPTNWDGWDDLAKSSELVGQWCERDARTNPDDTGDVFDTKWDRDEFSLSVATACCMVLQQLDSEGVLGSLKDGTRMLVGITAPNDDESIAGDYLRLLNPPELISWYPY